MYKIVAVAVLVAVAAALEDHSHGHGFSSQSVVLHQSHGHDQRGHEQLYRAPVVLGHHEQNHDYHAHPKYEYEYKVSDPHTGDNKYQHESRDGDRVQGVYSLHEADGTLRTVHYTADEHSGFHAEVQREGHAQHIVPQHQEYHH